jgi:glycosyltransferase involved in cell wall biosynthesis
VTERLKFIPDRVAKQGIKHLVAALCRDCSGIIAPGEVNRQELLSYGVETPISVVHNGIDVDHFEVGDREEVRRTLRISPDETVLMYTGRLAPEKDLHLLVDVLSDARRSAEFKTVFVGSGTEKDSLKVHAEEGGLELHLPGSVPYMTGDTPCIRDYLAAADIWVTASKSEVNPLSAMEGQAASLPIACLRAPGLDEIVRQGIDGFLAADDSEMADDVVRLVNNQDLRDQFAGQARLNARANHNFTICARNRVSVYSGLVSG